MTENREATEKSISEADFRQIWRGLTHNQRRFAVAMLDSKSKKEAALAIGIEPDTCYRWNGEIELAIEYMLSDAKETAIGILEDVLNKAAMIKATGLDSNDEDMRQKVASEIMDRVMGKATQPTTNEYDGEIRIVIQYEDDNPNPA